IMTGRLAGSSYRALNSSMLIRGTSCSVAPAGTVGCTVWTGGAPEGRVGVLRSVEEPAPFVGWAVGTTSDAVVGTSVGKLAIGVGTGATVELVGLPNRRIIAPSPITVAAISAPNTYGNTSRFGVVVTLVT